MGGIIAEIRTSNGIPYNACQTCTILERIASNTCNAIWDFNVSQTFTFMKRIFTYGYKTIWQLNANQTRAI